MTDIIQFASVANVPVYPDDISLFGSTKRIGGFIVGEYNGVMVLDPYLGTWPVPIPIAYEDEFLPLQFLKELTQAEVQSLVASANATIRDYVDIRMQIGQLMISPLDAGFIAFVNEMETQAIIDVPRRDILLLGVPVIRT